MKDLSVIIVNFNVKELLNQCLMSLKTALEGIKAEIIVVDNASTDGSQAFFDNYQSKDPFYGGIRFVFLNENLGFSKANNIGIGMSEGALVLLLNPDTIVTAGALQKCIEQFQKNPQAGAVGVRMVDGDGVFLKESKRGYPSLKTTLFKSIGLSELFPRSSIFGKYHLGNINEYATAQVEILCGAFMMIRGELLKKIEGFDERFFMYGEDIDLSIRIAEAGWQLFYLGDVTIIHFKGGSTSKGSFQHIRQFYHAMILFVEKYYTGGLKKIIKPLVIMGIVIRGLVSFMAYSLMKFIPPYGSRHANLEKVKKQGISAE